MDFDLYYCIECNEPLMDFLDISGICQRYGLVYTEEERPLLEKHREKVISQLS